MRVMVLQALADLNGNRRRIADDVSTVRLMKAVLRAVADVVVALHGLGVSHRDIKPTNVLLATRPDCPSLDKMDVVLCDFNLAIGPVNEATAKLDLPGSMPYVPPEVLSKMRERKEAVQTALKGAREASFGNEHRVLNTLVTRHARGNVGAVAALLKAKLDAPALLAPFATLDWTKLDVYSIGMLVWRLFHPDEQNPFGINHKKPGADGDSQVVSAILAGTRPNLGIAPAASALAGPWRLLLGFLPLCWAPVPGNRPVAQQVSAALHEAADAFEHAPSDARLAAPMEVVPEAAAAVTAGAPRWPQKRRLGEMPGRQIEMVPSTAGERALALISAVQGVLDAEAAPPAPQRARYPRDAAVAGAARTAQLAEQEAGFLSASHDSSLHTTPAQRRAVGEAAWALKFPLAASEVAYKRERSHWRISDGSYSEYTLLLPSGELQAQYEVTHRASNRAPPALLSRLNEAPPLHAHATASPSPPRSSAGRDNSSHVASGVPVGRSRRRRRDQGAASL